MSPGGLLLALEKRMGDLAARERFEEAALARDRLWALAEGLGRSRVDSWLLGSGELALRDPGGALVRLVGGSLARGDPATPIPSPCPRERADELSAVRAWLTRNHIHLEHAARPLAEPVDGGAELHRLLARLRPKDRRSHAPGDLRP
jgi:hypothetical protein